MHIRANFIHILFCGMAICHSFGIAMQQPIMQGAPASAAAALAQAAVPMMHNQLLNAQAIQQANPGQLLTYSQLGNIEIMQLAVAPQHLPFDVFASADGNIENLTDYQIALARASIAQNVFQVAEDDNSLVITEKIKQYVIFWRKKNSAMFGKFFKRYQQIDEKNKSFFTGGGVNTCGLHAVKNAILGVRLLQNANLSQELQQLCNMSIGMEWFDAAVEQFALGIDLKTPQKNWKEILVRKKKSEESGYLDETDIRAIIKEEQNRADGLQGVLCEVLGPVLPFEVMPDRGNAELNELKVTFDKYQNYCEAVIVNTGGHWVTVLVNKVAGKIQFIIFDSLNDISHGSCDEVYRVMRVFCPILQKQKLPVFLCSLLIKPEQIIGSADSCADEQKEDLEQSVSQQSGEQVELPVLVATWKQANIPQQITLTNKQLHDVSNLAKIWARERLAMDSLDRLFDSVLWRLFGPDIGKWQRVQDVVDRQHVDDCKVKKVSQKLFSLVQTYEKKENRDLLHDNTGKLQVGRLVSLWSLSKLAITIAASWYIGSTVVEVVKNNWPFSTVTPVITPVAQARPWYSWLCFWR